MTRTFVIACVASLVTGCTAAQLTTAGVPASQAAQIATVTQDVVAAGQLFCTASGTLYQAGSVNVSGQTAAAVASACAALTVGSTLVSAVPVPAVPGQTVVVATASLPPA